MPESKSTLTDPKQWSLALRERYRCALPEDMVDWFDNNYWHRQTGGEFDQPVAPETLLDEAPEYLWPGFMLPDSLPLLGNRYGDWLCLRVGPDDNVTEVVHWYHGGGDWMPWGKSLADAVAFDSLRSRLPGRRQYYANIAAEFDQQFGPSSIPAWAASHLPADVAEWLINPVEGDGEIEGLADRMIAGDVAQVAVRCELILAVLDSPLREKIDPCVARELGISWEGDVVRWLFDNSLITPTFLDRLGTTLKCDANTLLGQDWNTAHAHASIIAQHRDDLGWAHDIIAWNCERNEDYGDAVRHYAKALMCSSFADQSIRFCTHWFPDAAGKFAASRIQRLSEYCTDETKKDPYLHLYLESKGQSLRSRVTTYWMRLAEQSANEGRWSDAYDSYYQAGWDLGTDDLRLYRDILRRLVEAAENAGHQARAAVARTHLNCLLNRLR